MDQIKRISAAVAALTMCANICSAVPAVYAEDYSASAKISADKSDVIYINSAEEFAEFAKDCTLDSYSVGKTFVLNADISFADKEFVFVPSFGGVFDGNGHKISGFSITDSGSVMGLFRYVEKTGRVKNLNVSGKVSPSGSAKKCGGIAGVNKGTIYGCTFNGVITGKEQCGGIVGLNDENGMVASCKSLGRIEANHFAGGIAGQNTGFIMQCENASSVNTSATDSSLDLDNLKFEDLYSTESASDITDCGGITGYSTGSIQNCINRGMIGYPHIGYNIGGICGRQNGYISRCENYGTINGRKDTGGIVGQAEPHFSLLFSETGMNKLRDRLDEMNDIIDKTIDDANNSSNQVSGDMDDTIDILQQVRSDSDDFLDEADRVINSNIDSINELSARVSDLIDMSEPASDSFSKASDSMTDALDTLWEAGDMMADSLDSTDQAFDIIFPGLEDLSDSIKSLGDANKNLRDSLSSLNSGLGDEESMKDAIDSLKDNLDDFKDTNENIKRIITDMLNALENYNDSTETKDAVEKIKNALEKLSGVSDSLADDLDKAEDDLDAIKTLYDAGIRDPEAYDTYISDILDILSEGSGSEFFDGLADLIDGISDLVNSDAASNLKDVLERCSDDIRDTIDNAPTATIIYPNVNISSLYDVIEYLKKSADGVDSAGESAQSLIDRIQDAWDYVDDASASLIAAAYKAEEAVQYGNDSVTYISDGMDCVHDIIDYFAGKPEISFTGADDAFIEKRDTLSDSIQKLLDSLSVLNDSTSGSVDVLSEDFRQINDKASEVSDAVLDLVDELNDKPTELSDYTQDISAEDKGGWAEGKISASKNYGQVNGDVSVGGIAGTMGIENSIDPEGDIEKVGNRSYDFVYQSRTVVRECVNSGEVISKKDNVGGIVGEMDTGCVINSIGMGSVQSTDGGYAGGIAGKSSAAIYGSSAMCRIEGGDYVGGIAGSGHDIHSCVSFVDILDSDENTGAVAGECDGELENNVYSGGDVGAVDGVSYSEKAYPITYEEMIAMDGTPEEFRVLTLVFKNEDDIVGTVDFKYGESVSEDQLPAVPKKDGYFSRWEEHDYEHMTYGGVINAEFFKNVTTLSSEMTRENGFPVMLAEGTFTDKDTLTAENVSGDDWNVSIPDDGAESHLIRFLPLNGASGTNVFVDGQKVDTEEDGKYLTFTVTSCDFTITTEEHSYNIPLIAGASAGGAAVIIAAVAAGVHKKKKKALENVIRK